MLDAESPFTPLNGSLWPKTTTSRRLPLQPKNTPSNHNLSEHAQPNPKKSTPISSIYYSNNKENIPDKEVEVKVSPMDASLAEELNTVRKRLERLRRDRDTTERMLILRDRVFEVRLQELRLRGEFQKQLEGGVDRLYRLKQLRIHSMRMSPIRSLREMELQKRTRDSTSQSEVEWVDRSATMDPSSTSSMSNSR